MSNLTNQVVRLALNFNLVSADLLSRVLPLDFGPGLAFLEINYENLRNQKSPLEPRRPVSAYRVARELRLPYETSRRYANQLVDIGWCERLDRGFVVAEQGVGKAAVAATTPAIWEAVGHYVDALKGAGLEMPEGAFNSPFYVKSRVSLEASLHFLNLLRIGCDIFDIDAYDALLMFAILTANTAHITEGLSGAQLAAGVGEPIPDSERRPVSAYRLAQDLRAPYETIRRHVRRLVKADLCVDAPDGGVIAPARAHNRPEIREGVSVINAEVARFLQAIAAITPLPLVEPQAEPVRRSG